MSAKLNDPKWLADLCKALGLDEKLVVNLTIKIRPDYLVTVEVERAVFEDELEAVTKALAEANAAGAVRTYCRDFKAQPPRRQCQNPDCKNPAEFQVIDRFPNPTDAKWVCMEHIKALDIFYYNGSLLQAQHDGLTNADVHPPLRITVEEVIAEHDKPVITGDLGDRTEAVRNPLEKDWR